MLKLDFELLLLGSDDPFSTALLTFYAWLIASGIESQSRAQQSLQHVAVELGQSSNVRPMLTLAKRAENDLLNRICSTLRKYSPNDAAYCLHLAIRLLVANDLVQPSRNQRLFLLADSLGVPRSRMKEIFFAETGHQMHQGRQSQKEAPQQSNDEELLRSYAVLGLAAGACQKEVRDAYRMLAKIHHPDNFYARGRDSIPKATETFKRIKAAHDYLMQHPRTQK